MTEPEYNALKDSVSLLLEHLKTDIQLAQTREEHIRLTQRGAEVEVLLYQIGLLAPTASERLENVIAVLDAAGVRGPDGATGMLPTHY